MSVDSPELPPPQPPEWQRCSFDHSILADRKTHATHEFVIKVDGGEVKGRMCGAHGAAAIDRCRSAMKEAGMGSPEAAKMAEDIARRDPHRDVRNPDRIDSWRVKPPTEHNIGLDAPVAPPPDRPLGGYDGRTI